MGPASSPAGTQVTGTPPAEVEIERGMDMRPGELVKISPAETSIVTPLDTRARHELAARAFRTALAGLRALHVEVEPVNEDAERDGLRRVDLEAAVVAVLEQAGLAVVTAPKLFADVSGTPVLHIDVMTIRLDGRYGYSIRLELWQAVRLARLPGLQALALTWSAPQLLGTVAAPRLSDLCDTVRDTVIQFVAQCRAATAEAAPIETTAAPATAPGKTIMYARLKKFLEARGAQFEVIAHDAAMSAQEQAAAMHLPEAIMAKGLIVRVRDGFVMAVIPASTDADLDRLKGLIGRGKIRLATAEEIGEVVPDCSPGMIPPFGALYGLRSFVDERLLLAAQVAAPAGHPGAAIGLSSVEFRRLVDATLGNFAATDAPIATGRTVRRGRGRASSGMRSRR
jgi:Ala-tRNA(Pro) deacylase